MVAWVCDHVTLSVSGAGGRYFVETRGQLVLTGTGGTAWAPTGSRLSLIGDANDVFAESGASIRDDGSGNTVIDCTAVTYDLSAAPADGC